MAVLKRLICIMLLLALLGLPFSGNRPKTSRPGNNAEAEKYASQLGRLRLLYREAALIAEAVCLGAADTYDKEQNTEAETDAEAKAEAETDAEAKAEAETDAEAKAEAETDAEAKAEAETDAETKAKTETEAETFCRYEITFVYAGKAREGESITVRGSGIAGSEKLLYLKTAETDCPEGLPCYEICENGEFNLNGSMIVLNDGTLLPAGILETDILAQEKIMRVPSQYMYYKDFNSLISGCDEIFIARAESVSEYVPAECRSSVKGESVERSCSVSEAELTVLNGLAASRVYGEKLTLTLVSEMTDYVIDNESLAVIPKRNAEALKAGEIYIFFIKHGEDLKQEAYFLLNPYQGYIKLNGDALVSCTANAALNGIKTLHAFADALYSSFANGETVQKADAGTDLA